MVVFGYQQIRMGWVPSTGMKGATVVVCASKAQQAQGNWTSKPARGGPSQGTSIHWQIVPTALAGKSSVLRLPGSAVADAGADGKCL
jgi:hypothetical protein